MGKGTVDEWVSEQMCWWKVRSGGTSYETILICSIMCAWITLA